MLRKGSKGEEEKKEGVEGGNLSFLSSRKKQASIFLPRGDKSRHTLPILVKISEGRESFLLKGVPSVYLSVSHYCNEIPPIIN